MKQKNLIAFLLTGLFLMNLFVLHSGGLMGLLSGEKVTVVNPFCKKSKFSNKNGDSATIDYSEAQSIEIPAVCTTVIDFKNPVFSVIPVEDNFKIYVFNERPYSKLFSERYYIPPRV